ncbi:hypothetical protein C8J57DRAFT_1606015 [Mycena rebaudengoi]|nr:hypothetical protein C8J57DRAFT_1606015 [Mycena rebaudengoi]
MKKQHRSSKTSRLPGTGWCEAPYRLGNWMTGAHTIIHEMTHLSMIGVAAGLGGPTSHEGTTDVLGEPDENDHNTDTYGGGADGYAPIAAIALRQHWIDHLAQPNTLAEPPVGSTENAESYAAAATEHFFAKKCALGDYDGANLLIIEP